MINAIRNTAGGNATTGSTHDPVPGTPEEGIKITVGVEVDTENAMIDVDLRNNPDTMPCGLNLSEACARTAAMIGIFNSIEDVVPTNGGSFRRIRIHIREGSVAGGGKHPTSMSVATTNLADRVTSSVQCAFSQIQDGLGLAECGAVIPASGGVISGRDFRIRSAPRQCTLCKSDFSGFHRWGRHGPNRCLVYHRPLGKWRYVLHRQHRAG